MLVVLEVGDGWLVSRFVVRSAFTAWIALATLSAACTASTKEDTADSSSDSAADTDTSAETDSDSDSEQEPAVVGVSLYVDCGPLYAWSLAGDLVYMGAGGNAGGLIVHAVDAGDWYVVVRDPTETMCVQTSTVSLDWGDQTNWSITDFPGTFNVTTRGCDY